MGIYSFDQFNAPTKFPFPSEKILNLKIEALFLTTYRVQCTQTQIENRKF